MELDYTLLVLVALTLISLCYYLPSYAQARKVRRIEKALSEALSELSESLKSGYSLEHSLKETAEKRKDALGKELQILMKDMEQYPLKEALLRFGKRSNSRAISRVVSILNIALEADANLAEVIKRISEELWSGYILEREREAKVGTYSVLIILCSALLIPGIIGFIFGAFGPAFAKDKPGEYQALLTAFQYFVVALGACGALMSGCVTGKLKQAFLLIPTFMFIAYIAFIGAVKLMPKLMGV
ncbi:MAG: type II secretion system F family protein [Candidatus Thermoplasmatota archaeon]|nr:type II secretion system F family protein [Candidatus Thermoplasmatota archaeon]